MVAATISYYAQQMRQAPYPVRNHPCRYEMACGHCRRPREKNNLGVQLCSIRGGRALPETEGHRKWCFEDRKLALQALWRAPNGTPNRLRRAHGGSSDTRGAPCARSGTPSPLGKRWRACGLQRIEHPTGDARDALEGSSYNDPHAGPLWGRRNLGWVFRLWLKRVP